MMNLCNRVIALLAVVAAVCAHGVALADAPSALVLETGGETIPGVHAYDEMFEGTTISLPGRAKLVFLHYATCRTVVVIGGRITFGLEKYAIDGGAKESEARVPCPRALTLKPGGEMAGATIRSNVGDRLTLAPQPTFVLLGPRANDFVTVRVSRSGKVVLEEPVKDRRFLWPSEAKPLVVDAEYEMALIPRDPGADSITKRFRVRAPAADQPGGEVLTLIRVE